MSENRIKNAIKLLWDFRSEKNVRSGTKNEKMPLGYEEVQEVNECRKKEQKCQKMDQKV